MNGQVVRWPDKPTSGRYVYGYPENRWIWQCDLHSDLPDDEVSPGGEARTMQEAFAQALAHAQVCPFNNRAVAHEHRPGYECPACGHVALRQFWMDPLHPDKTDIAHMRLVRG